MTDQHLRKMAEDLLPCPFCGGAARVGEWATWYVKCMGCGSTQMGLNRTEAVADWNTRAPDPRSEAAEGERDAIKGDRGLWPLETRDAVDELESRLGISLCSGQHNATWVARALAAEAKVSALTEALGRSVATLEQVDGSLQSMADEGILANTSWKFVKRAIRYGRSALPQQKGSGE